MALVPTLIHCALDQSTLPEMYDDFLNISKT